MVLNAVGYGFILLYMMAGRKLCQRGDGRKQVERSLGGRMYTCAKLTKSKRHQLQAKASLEKYQSPAKRICVAPA